MRWGSDPHFGYFHFRLTFGHVFYSAFNYTLALTYRSKKKKKNLNGNPQKRPLNITPLQCISREMANLNDKWWDTFPQRVAATRCQTVVKTTDDTFVNAYINNSFSAFFCFKFCFLMHVMGDVWMDEWNNNE